VIIERIIVPKHHILKGCFTSRHALPFLWCLPDVPDRYILGNGSTHRANNDRTVEGALVSLSATLLAATYVIVFGVWIEVGYKLRQLRGKRLPTRSLL
jgi:hypothetical protein